MWNRRNVSLLSRVSNFYLQINWDRMEKGRGNCDQGVPIATSLFLHEPSCDGGCVKMGKMGRMCCQIARVACVHECLWLFLKSSLVGC